uniref:Nucleolar protein 7 C-terminal domain-containing protein n=1 Tax=Arion vulgaris TaxID=1028688 RepID=A0A0B6Z551_9EUPU
MSSRTVPEMAFDASSSDDDDAPEEVSVSASRQQGLNRMKDIQELLRKNKDGEKEKRRQRNEMFRIQKENKLKDLSKRKLPEDVLEAVSAKTKKSSQIENDNNPLTLDSAHDSDDDEEVNKSDDGDDALSDSGVEDVSDGHSGMEEFIPIGTKGGLALVTPGALTKTSQTSAQKALSFKNSRLYHQSSIPRENTKQRRARLAKRKANRIS